MFIYLASIIALMIIPPRPTPPDEFRMGTSSIVYFVDSQEEMNKICTEAVGSPPGKNMVYLGCAGYAKSNKTLNMFVGQDDVPVMFVSNPCLYPEEKYARHVCHEMGHINGWPGDHPNPQ